MQILESVGLKGDLSIVLYNELDEETYRQEINNLVVKTGKELVATLISGSTAKPSHIALGSGTNSPDLTNTGLSIETVGTRKTFNSVTVAENVVTFTSIWVPGDSTGTYMEAGIFNSASAGVMLCRTAFSPITKTVGEKLIITWNIRVN